jgi:alpha-tubulin suppressor-like RCC1 family protein
MIAALGQHHTACVTCDHQLITFDARLARSPDPLAHTQMPVPPVMSITRFPLSTPIIQVSCGAKNLYVLTKTGLVYSSGSNCCGEGGTGSIEDTTDMVQVMLDESPRMPVAMIAAGSSHCLCVAANGVVYGWGRNAEGQLGRPDPSSLFTPMRVCVGPGDVPSVFVAAGGRGTAIVAADGMLRVCGNNRQGQLGMGAVYSVWSVTRVCSLMTVQAVSCSDTKTFVLCQDTSVWYAGVENMTRDTSSFLPPSAYGKFNRVDTTRLPGRPAQIICGHSRTIIIDAHGGVFSCTLHAPSPWNAHYECGANMQRMSVFSTTLARIGDFTGPSSEMLLAFAMGVHPRLGLGSHVQALSRVQDVLSVILRGSRTDIFDQCSTHMHGVSCLFGGSAACDTSAIQ